jgi:hypothetical protein
MIQGQKSVSQTFPVWAGLYYRRILNIYRLYCTFTFKFKFKFL